MNHHCHGHNNSLPPPPLRLMRCVSNSPSLAVLCVLLYTKRNPPKKRIEQRVRKVCVCVAVSLPPPRPHTHTHSYEKAFLGTLSSPLHHRRLLFFPRPSEVSLAFLDLPFPSFYSRHHRRRTQRHTHTHTCIQGGKGHYHLRLVGVPVLQRITKAREGERKWDREREMPPRKGPSPAVQATATTPPSLNSAAAESAGADDGNKRKYAKLDTAPLTNDEKNFLSTVLSLTGSSSPVVLAAKGKAAGGDGAPVSAAGKQLLDDAWWSDVAMPKFHAIAEKVLKMAAEQYHANHKDYIPPSSRSEDSATMAGGGNNASATVVQTAAAAANAPPPPPAGSPAQFVEENAYLVEQLKQLPQCPFTVERLAEILSQPFMYHSSKDGKLKPEALQASLRRCILVTYPVVVSVSADGVGDREGGDE